MLHTIICSEQNIIWWDQIRTPRNFGQSALLKCISAQAIIREVRSHSLRLGDHKGRQISIYASLEFVDEWDDDDLIGSLYSSGLPFVGWIFPAWDLHLCMICLYIQRYVPPPLPFIRDVLPRCTILIVEHATWCSALGNLRRRMYH